MVMHDISAIILENETHKEKECDIELLCGEITIPLTISTKNASFSIPGISTQAPQSIIHHFVLTTSRTRRCLTMPCFS
jgi:hypothetical protein